MHDFHEQFNFNCVPCDGTQFLQNNREVKHHVYVKRQTRISTTWPSFLVTCRLLFRLSAQCMISMSNSISTVSRAMGHSFFKTIERLSITFTSNGKREFLPRDQVSLLLVVCCLLFLQLNCDIYTLYSFCHLRPQIARARGGGRRGKATAVINIKSQEAGTIILQSKLNKLCG